MLLRKALSAYVTSFAFVSYFSVVLAGDSPAAALANFAEWLQWMAFLSLYAFPVVLIYGSLVSIMMEAATRRWVASEPFRLLLSCAGHLAFGALFGIPFGFPFNAATFTFAFAAGALLYFLADRLINYTFARGWKKSTVITALALPLLIIAAVGVASI